MKTGKAKLSKQAKLQCTLENLDHLPRSVLQDHWQSYFSSPPPYRMSDGFLRSAIGYHIQTVQHGRLKTSMCAHLAKIAQASKNNPATVSSIPSPPPLVTAGTRLLREWNGVTHEVHVVADGVVWNGKTYRSLSEVARIITGTKWSGPLFFGLKKREATHAHSTR